jgi:CBS domain-containing protein
MTTYSGTDTPIRDVLRTTIACVDASVTLRGAAVAMQRVGAGSLVVMDGDEVAGIVTERDIVNALADDADPDKMEVAEVESSEPRYLTLGDSVGTAAGIMLAAGCRHLPVVDDGVAIGIVSIRDIVRAITT